MNIRPSATFARATLAYDRERERALLDAITLQSIAHDAAVAISLALQHGVSIEAIRHAVTRCSDGDPRRSGRSDFSRFIFRRCAMSDTPTIYGRTTINVVVRPAPNTGWFEVHTRKSRLCITQYPLRDVGRGFLARGYKPGTVITFRHDLPWPAITTTFGQAAQNTETFEDHNIVRPVFGRAR
jgi:hypothetical protein